MSNAGKDYRRWQKSAAFAARHHVGQKRKDGETPYIAHPFRVAMTVRHVFGVDDEPAICAALLHDVIEDTTVDFDELLEEFGENVAATVAALSKDMRLPEREREVAYDRQLAEASWRARLVKLADVFDNLCDWPGSEPPIKALDKARRAIRCAGDDPRLARAVEVVEELLRDETSGE